MTPHELEVWLREAAATVTPLVTERIALVMVAVDHTVEQVDAENKRITFQGKPIVYTTLPPDAVAFLLKALNVMQPDVKKVS